MFFSGSNCCLIGVQVSMDDLVFRVNSAKLLRNLRDMFFVGFLKWRTLQNQWCSYFLCSIHGKKKVKVFLLIHIKTIHDLDDFGWFAGIEPHHVGIKFPSISQIWINPAGDSSVAVQVSQTVETRRAAGVAWSLASAGFRGVYGIEMPRWRGKRF